MSSIDFANINLNEIYQQAVKFQIKQEQNRKNVKKYQEKKRDEKDESFLQKHREYARNYYEKNKEKVIQKQLQRYYKNKIDPIGERTEV